MYKCRGERVSEGVSNEWMNERYWQLKRNNDDIVEQRGGWMWKRTKQSLTGF